MMVKKFLAFVLAVIYLCISSVTSFAAVTDVPLSNYPLVSDAFSQFNQGDGNYLLPLDLSTFDDSFLSYLNNDQYSFILTLSYSSFPVFSIFFYDSKYNLIFSSYSSSHNGYSCSHYGFRIPPSVKFNRYNFFYNSSNQNFYSRPGGYTPLYADAYCPKLGNTLVFCFTNDTSIPSQTNGFRFSDIKSVGFIDKDNYPSPIEKHTLTINYLYAEGVPAAEPVTQTLAVGEGYSIQSPEIPGYTPDVPLVTGTMPGEDLTIDVYYSKTFYPLTIKYQYQDGTQVAADMVQQYPAGFAYEVPSPQVVGHQPDKPTVAGTMPEKAVTEVVTYAVQSYYLTVDYRYEDGTQAADSHREQVPFGVQYSVSSPVITGYTPSLETVSGIMPGEDVTATVTYREASGGSSGGGTTGPGDGGSPGGGDFTGDDPFAVPELPAYSGDDPFQIPGLPPSLEDPFQIPGLPAPGSDPFQIPGIPGPSGYDPFLIPGLPGYSYDPFVMPDKYKEDYG